MAIHGYDAVSYHQDGAPERGLAEFSTKHRGAVYRFASKENLRQLGRNPIRFAPQYWGICAYGVAVGKRLDGDPEVYKIVDKKLYFNLIPRSRRLGMKICLETSRTLTFSGPKSRGISAEEL